MQLKFPVNRVLERPRSKDGVSLPPRTWVCTNGERDDTGTCRVFREELPPLVEEKENPIYDELVLKEPLKFGVDGNTFKQIAKKIIR